MSTWSCHGLAHETRWRYVAANSAPTLICICAWLTSSCSAPRNTAEQQNSALGLVGTCLGPWRRAHRSILARSESLAHVEGEVRVLIRTGLCLHNGCAVTRVVAPEAAGVQRRMMACPPEPEDGEVWRQVERLRVNHLNRRSNGDNLRRRRN